MYESSLTLWCCVLHCCPFLTFGNGSSADSGVCMQQEEMEAVGRLQEVHQENASLRHENSSLRTALAGVTPAAPVLPHDAGNLDSQPKNLTSAFTLAAHPSASTSPSSVAPSREASMDAAASAASSPAQQLDSPGGQSSSRPRDSLLQPSSNAVSPPTAPLFLAFDSSLSPEQTVPAAASASQAPTYSSVRRYWESSETPHSTQSSAPLLTPIMVQPTPAAIHNWDHPLSSSQPAAAANSPGSAADEAHRLVSLVAAEVAAVRASAQRPPQLPLPAGTPQPSRLRHSSDAADGSPVRPAQPTAAAADEAASEPQTVIPRHGAMPDGNQGEPLLQQQRQQVCTPAGVGTGAGTPRTAGRGHEDSGLVRRLRAQFGRLTGSSAGGAPGTPMSLAVDRRVTFLRAIDRLEVCTRFCCLPFFPLWMVCSDASNSISTRNHSFSNTCKLPFLLMTVNEIQRS